MEFQYVVYGVDNKSAIFSREKHFSQCIIHFDWFSFWNFIICARVEFVIYSWIVAFPGSLYTASINIWIIKIHSRMPCLVVIACWFGLHKKQRYIVNSMQSLTFHSPLSVPHPARPSAAGVEKVFYRANGNTHIIQYTVTAVWFLFDIFVTARAALLRHNLWSTIFLFPFRSQSVCFWK